MKNYYQVLGVQPTASKEEIKEAYKKLSKKMHPDVNSGDEFFSEFFKNINEAHQVLIDDAQRKTYTFKLNTYSTDINFLKEKEIALREKEAALVQRLFRRKMLVNGSVSLLSGLAVIAIFSLSFNNNEATTASIDKHYEKEILAETPKNTMAVSAAYHSSVKTDGTSPANRVREARLFVPAVKIKTEHRVPVRTNVLQANRELAIKRLTAAEMLSVLHVIEKEKIRANNTSNTIRITRSDNSNVKNAFDLAAFLQTKGYVIAGRETTTKPVNGIRADCSTSCILLSVGIM